MRLCLVLLGATASCVFSDYGHDAEPPLAISMAIPADATAFDFSAFEGSTCDGSAQFHVGGEVLADLDSIRYEVGLVESISIEVGTYTFEAIAIDATVSPELPLAAGCAQGTVRANQTTDLFIDLVAIE